MKFCTVINCMDGRVQLPVIAYLQERFGAEYVDSITEAGPNRILALGNNDQALLSLYFRIEISLIEHGSVGVAVAGHHGCAGNPSPKSEQLEHLDLAVSHLKKRYDSVEVIGLWVDEKGRVTEV